MEQEATCDHEWEFDFEATYHLRMPHKWIASCKHCDATKLVAKEVGSADVHGHSAKIPVGVVKR